MIVCLKSILVNGTVNQLSELKEKHPDALDPWGKVARSYVKYAPNGESHEALNKRCGEFFG